jgi:hypothetical protein
MQELSGEQRANARGGTLTTVLLDSDWDDDRRRRAAYAGTFFLFSPRPASLELVELARSLLEAAFAPHHPTEAQHHLSVETYASVLAELKPAYIHHPDCKRYIRDLMDELGCDTSSVYFDVPKLRSATANGYLSTGIAYAFPPHRDMWYAAPPQQLNWWFPVYPVDPANGMALHPRYFDEPVPNNSADFNYYRCNIERATAATMIGTDTRVRPGTLDPLDSSDELRLVPPVGGVLMFSPQHLHSSLPNETGLTRCSVDFRTVHRGDVEGGIGADEVDNASTGTALRDFLRCTDLTRLPDDVIARYDDDSAKDYADALVYRPM